MRASEGSGRTPEPRAAVDPRSAAAGLSLTGSSDQTSCGGTALQDAARDAQRVLSPLWSLDGAA
jgi:hypothetical protein